MINRNKHIAFFQQLMKLNYTSTKVQFFFSIMTAGSDYDPYENNLTETNLNPKTIKAYIHDVTPEQFLYKMYGTVNAGTKEIICDQKYYTWFTDANKITIDSEEYNVLDKDSVGQTNKGSKTVKGSNSMTLRAFNMIKVVLMRKI